jgi:hypothetical protein
MNPMKSILWHHFLEIGFLILSLLPIIFRTEFILGSVQSVFSMQTASL